jgi:hypothetical protein
LGEGEARGGRRGWGEALNQARRSTSRRRAEGVALLPPPLPDRLQVAADVGHRAVGLVELHAHQLKHGQAWGVKFTPSWCARNSDGMYATCVKFAAFLDQSAGCRKRHGWRDAALKRRVKGLESAGVKFSPAVTFWPSLR